jgi:hypothetical protein
MVASVGCEIVAHLIRNRSLGNYLSENYRNLSEFFTTVSEVYLELQHLLFCGRFRGVLGVNSSKSNDFVAI